MTYRLTVLWADGTETRIQEPSTESKNQTINMLKAMNDVKQITCYSILDNGDIDKIFVI